MEQKSANDENRHGVQKPLWKRWWFWVVVVLVLSAIGGGANGGRGSNTTSSASASASPAESLASASSSPEITLKDSGSASGSSTVATNQAEEFAKNFSAANGAKMSDVAAFDPQDSAGQYYRTEYRLGAYKNAQAVHGKLGSLDVDVVAYRVEDGNPTMMRVYASGNADEIAADYPFVVRYFAPSATDTEIQQLVTQYNDGSYMTEVPSSFRRISSNLLERDGASGQFMVNAEF